MAEKKAVHVNISGRVQGVNFRMETARAAEGYGVNGWVMNKSDGSVDAYFEGDADNVDAMLSWCWKGPAMASVKDVAATEEPYQGKYNDFSVRHTF
ncbi:MAG: acylphosphatase [Thermodesulfobacteriota bacterium]